MKRAIFIFGLIIIIFLGTILNVMYGGYYTTPEEALNHSNLKNVSMENIVETVWIQEDQPIVFDVTKNGEFREIEFSKMELFGKLGWRYFNNWTIDTKKITPNYVAPTKMRAGIISDKRPNIIFGITKYQKANTIKVNGESPKFKKFEINKEEFTLWYIIEVDKLHIEQYKITSD